MWSHLWQRIAAFVQDDSGDDFESIAIGLFHRQFELNEAYRRYVKALGIEPNTLRRWQDIPAAPAAAFKDFDLTCCGVATCSKVFHSSGTTQANASKHWMDSDALRLYEVSLLRGYDLALGHEAGGLPIWAMMPRPHDAPHSSLSHMLETLGAQHWFWGDWRALAVALDALDAPVAIFGTGFAFVALFEEFPTRCWKLPAGSVLVNTGGFKGRTREEPRGRFYGSMRDRLGVPDNACLSEYGMSEMTSQFYSAGELGQFRAPRWLRTRVIDPLTGDDAAQGSAGLLRHYDLANWNSVCAIQTQDLGISFGEGFRLLGRAAEAHVRGCSLTVEELWNRG